MQLASFYGISVSSTSANTDWLLNLIEALQKVMQKHFWSKKPKSINHIKKMNEHVKEISIVQ